MKNQLMLVMGLLLSGHLANAINYSYTCTALSGPKKDQSIFVMLVANEAEAEAHVKK